MEEITAEDSDGYLVPELQDSEWELEYVEVASDENPCEMEYGWLIESYEFTNSEEDITLMCNVEAPENHPGLRDYEVYAYFEGGQGWLHSYRSRKDWWNGIRELMRRNPNEVIGL